MIKIYRKQLFTYLFRICGNKAVAEDLFQETLIKVWTNINKYSETSRFGSWLFSIAHNVAVDGLRKRKVRQKIFHSDEIQEISSLENPHTLIEAKEMNLLFEKTINSLPFKQKEIFLLRQHSEMTFKEIAELTNQPLNTVLSHMHLAVEKIRKALKD